MISIDELIAPVTAEQANEKLLGIIETLGIPARSWKRGGILRTMLRVFAIAYAMAFALVIAVTRSGFLELAEAGWLTFAAKHVYGVDRRPDSFATGILKLTNTGGGTWNRLPGEVRAKNPTTGKVYTNVDAIALTPGSEQLVGFSAVEQGSASSTGANTVGELETVLLGVTVTNPAAIIGSDSETDDELRIKCIAKLGSLSLRGPRGAYEYAVLTAVREDGSSVDINRHAISPSSSTGVVTVYVASPTGAPLAADLDIIRASIERYARPDSVTAIVAPAVEKPYVRAVTIWATKTAGVDAAGLSTLATNALIAMFQGYRIGGKTKPPNAQGYLYGDLVARTIIGAHPSIYDVDGLGADLALSPNEVATLGVTLTIRIVVD